MIGSPRVRRGRPFRALAGLALLVGMWFGWRIPLIAAQLGTVTALVVPGVAALAPARPAAVRRTVPRSLPRPLAPPEPLAVMQPEMRLQHIQLVSHRPMFLPPVPPPAAHAPSVPSPPVVPFSAPVSPVPRADATAFRLAQSAYDRLRTGQRREAAALFDAALSLQADNGQWQADRAALGRRWQLGGFALVRDGSGGGPAASPVLGGGQVGGSIAFLPDPYARRPLALVVRGNIAADPASIRSETAQAAIGIRQALLPGVSISAERLIAVGSATRSDWTLRLAAGAARGRFSAYGEAGVLGSGQAYGGAQASARMLRIGPATLDAGAWASLQTGKPDVWRVDVGPSVSTRWRAIRLQADWRQNVAGNAAPGSGPAVTISTGF